MRSAEVLRSSGVRVAVCAAAIGAALVGCASLTDAVPDALVNAMRPQAAAPVAANSSVAPVAVKPKAEPDAPVSVATLRAYDDALRALRAGRTEEAERSLRALAQANPQLGGPHANLGLIYRQQGKPELAVKALEQAIAVSPQQPVYFSQLGIAYRQHGEFVKARAAYERAIELDPGYATPMLNLAILHDLYLADGARALELYDRYLVLASGGDTVVSKWVADLKNRKPAASLLSKKEQ